MQEDSLIGHQTLFPFEYTIASLVQPGKNLVMLLIHLNLVAINQKWKLKVDKPQSFRRF